MDCRRKTLHVLLPGVEGPSIHTYRSAIVASCKKRDRTPSLAPYMAHVEGAHLRRAGRSEQEGGHGERMSLARLGREKTGLLQRRYDQVRQIANNKRRGTAARNGTGRTAGSAMAEVVGRSRQFQQARSRLCGSVGVVGVRRGIGRIPGRAGGSFVSGRQQGTRIR